MPTLLMNSQFLLLAATNLCLFLVVSTWSFLPIVIVDLGGNSIDVGLVMGSIGVTSLASLPLIAPLMDTYGRKRFVVGGILLIGLTNAGFLLFDTYSPLMILVRLVQGMAFAACFNGCATSIVDIVPPDKRAQGIGLFGISGSVAVSIGPYLGEKFLLTWGQTAYFLLLIGFGLIGFLTALAVRESERQGSGRRMQGFFLTAFRDRHLFMMVLAAMFGSGFAAMNTFFPLLARTLGIEAGMFFVFYGISLLAVRIFVGQLVDRVNREKLLLACLIGFGVMLVSTSQLRVAYETIFLGSLFGILQGLSYPSMMARMVDRASDHNRAVVVSLFTGSFGVGINVSVLAWGLIADSSGLPFMFLLGGGVMFVSAAIVFGSYIAGKHEPSLQKQVALETEPD
ncbi:MAG: MFS transporter [Desulfomonile tiedjei]|uniref:MFS transporter n=1 Tax=Desulfomonile tiedjei TaxID=2358 RepID=A0A9D6UZG5_9BACT|nr:MFS transporter [Desulfomonile tiedjei]